MNNARPDGPSGYRWERITRIFHELRYEIELGMMQAEINENIGFRWIVPQSKHFPTGVVLCEFRSRPMPRHAMNIDDLQPQLKVVK